MTRLLFRVFAPILIIMGFALPQAAAEQRVALVIGNGAYEAQPLDNPPNDAALMAETLREVGFEVVEEINADGRRMKRAVRKFGRLLSEAGEDAVGFVFYAGHGIQSKGENYMIPVDAQIQDALDVELEGVPASTVLSSLDQAGNRLNIVVMDACRNNPYKAVTRSAGSGLARMDAPSGTLIAYSTAPGKVAADGRGRNSPYTHALSRSIQTPGAKVEDVFKSVRVAVMDRTNGAQVPWESSSLTGDFYFLDKAPEPVAAPEPTAPSVPQNTVELTFWNSIKDGTSPALFESYLRQFPNGLFAELAKAKINVLNQQQAASKRQSDTAFFQSIQNSENKTEFQAYLAQFPNGTFASLAKARIAAIERAEQQQVAVLQPQAQPQTDADTAFWNQVKDARTKAELQAYLNQFPEGKYAAIARARISGIEEQRTVAALTTGAGSANPLDGTWKATVKGVTSLEQTLAPFCPYKMPPPSAEGQFTISGGAGEIRVEARNKDAVTLRVKSVSANSLSVDVMWRGKRMASKTLPIENGVAEGVKRSGSNCKLTYRLEQLDRAAPAPAGGPRKYVGIFQGDGGGNISSQNFCGASRQWPMTVNFSGNEVVGKIDYQNGVTLTGKMTSENRFRGKVVGVGGGSRFSFKGQVKNNGVELSLGGETSYCSGHFVTGG